LNIYKHLITDYIYLQTLKVHNLHLAYTHPR